MVSGWSVRVIRVSRVRFRVSKVLGVRVEGRACLDQHLIAIRSWEVLGDHVRSKT